MRQITLVLIAALVAGACGYFLVQRRHAVTAAALDSTRGDDLHWLRSEFRLSETEFAAVKKLHEDYSVVCAKHCADIAGAQRRLRELTLAQAPEADLAAARRDVAALEEVCNTATRAHIHRVAAAMPPDQGPRYVAMVEPHLAHSPHDGSRGMDH